MKPEHHAEIDRIKNERTRITDPEELQVFEATVNPILGLIAARGAELPGGSKATSRGTEVHAAVAMHLENHPSPPAGISSDDPDALTKLRAQLAQRQADRNIEKKWNVEMRKRAKARLARKLAQTGTGTRLPSDLCALTPTDHLAIVDELRKAGAPLWVVGRMTSMARAFAWMPQFGNNTTADIRRLEERIQQLETRDAAPERRYEGELSAVPSLVDAGIKFVIEDNKAENRVQISFSRRPSREITRRLGGAGGAGFRWAGSLGVWQRHLSDAAWRAACDALGVDPALAGQPVAAAAAAPVESVRYPVKLVTTSGARSLEPGQAAVDAIAALGFEYMGPNASKVQRAELQGAPRFRGLIGPMWDQGGLRYECTRTYEELSR
jgi:hypothetical protein